MRRLILLMVFALGATVARAEDGLLYLGAGITSNHVNSTGVPGYGDIYPGISSTSWKVFAGIRPIRLFAVEVDYLDLGSKAHASLRKNPPTLRGPLESNARRFAELAEKLEAARKRTDRARPHSRST